jgi:hypothetical protein
VTSSEESDTDDNGAAANKESKVTFEGQESLVSDTLFINMSRFFQYLLFGR